MTKATHKDVAQQSPTHTDAHTHWKEQQTGNGSLLTYAPANIKSISHHYF